MSGRLIRIEDDWMLDARTLLMTHRDQPELTIELFAMPHFSRDGSYAQFSKDDCYFSVVSAPTIIGGTDAAAPLARAAWDAVPEDIRRQARDNVKAMIAAEKEEDERERRDARTPGIRKALDRTARKKSGGRAARSKSSDVGTPKRRGRPKGSKNKSPRTAKA